ERGIEQARRASPYINGVHHGSSECLWQSYAESRIQNPMRRYLAAHSVDIRSKPAARHHARVEIAIGAFRLAERNLYVDSHPVLHRQNFSTYNAKPGRPQGAFLK